MSAAYIVLCDSLLDCSKKCVLPFVKSFNGFDYLDNRPPKMLLYHFFLQFLMFPEMFGFVSKNVTVFGLSAIVYT